MPAPSYVNGCDVVASGVGVARRIGSLAHKKTGSARQASGPRSTRRPKVQLPPRHTALGDYGHSQSGDRDHFVLTWAGPHPKDLAILYGQDDGYISYFRNTKANSGGWPYCTSALAQSCKKSFSLERFTGDGVPHVTVEGRHGCPHQSALSALWRQTEISAHR